MKGREQWQAEALLLAQQGTVEQALSYLAGQYERLAQAQSLNIASLEGLLADLRDSNRELLNQLKLQAAQWSGTVARQRLTIAEQGDKIKGLHDEVAELEAYVDEFRREDDASSGNR